MNEAASTTTFMRDLAAGSLCNRVSAPSISNRPSSGGTNLSALHLPQSGSSHYRLRGSGEGGRQQHLVAREAVMHSESLYACPRRQPGRSTRTWWNLADTPGSEPGARKDNTSSTLVVRTNIFGLWWNWNTRKSQKLSPMRHAGSSPAKPTNTRAVAQPARRP